MAISEPIGKPELDALHLRLWRAAAPIDEAEKARSEQAGQKYLAGRQRGASPTALFDSIHYTQQLPWFMRDKIDPLDHYLSSGWASGFLPHIAFDAAHLAEQLGVVTWTVPPLIAFYESNKEVSAHPLFDVDIYARHVDVKATRFRRLFECFVDWSGKARTPFSRLFSLHFYGRSEPVTQFGTINPLIHYLMTDTDRRRDPNPMFHNRWYDAQYPAKRGQPPDPLIRFAKFGLMEGNLPNPFSRQELRLYEAESGVPIEMLLPYVDISRFDRLPERTTASRAALGGYDGARQDASADFAASDRSGDTAATARQAAMASPVPGAGVATDATPLARPAPAD